MTACIVRVDSRLDSRSSISATPFFDMPDVSTRRRECPPARSLDACLTDDTMANTI